MNFLREHKDQIALGALLTLSAREMKSLWNKGMSMNNIRVCIRNMMLSLGSYFLIKNSASIALQIEEFIERSWKIVRQAIKLRDVKRLNYDEYKQISREGWSGADFAWSHYSDKKNDLINKFEHKVRIAGDELDAMESIYDAVVKTGCKIERFYYYRVMEDDYAVLIETNYSLEEKTSGVEFLKALNQSRFKATLVSLLMSLKFSAALSLFSERFNFSDNVKLGIAIFSDVLLSGKMFTEISEVLETFASEILPAFITGDCKKISADSYTSQIDLINEAIAISKKSAFDSMEEFVVKYRGTKPAGDFNRVAQFQAVLTDIQKFVIDRSNKHMFNDVSRLSLTLQQERLKWSNYLKTEGKRFIPYCVGMRGDPATGKSTRVQRFMLLLAGTLKLSLYVNEAGEKVPYVAVNVSEQSNFLDNVNMSTETLIFDDMGIVFKEFINKTGNNPLSIFMQVQGSNLYLIPRSDLDNKIGQFFFNKLTFITSNIEGYGSKAIISTPAAFDRRVHVDIHCTFNNKRADHNDKQYHVSFINFEDNTRYTKTYKMDGTPESANQVEAELDRDVKHHAELYQKWRHDCENKLNYSLCSKCEELEFHCVCPEGPTSPNIFKRKERPTNIHDVIPKCPVCEVYTSLCTCSQTIVNNESLGLWITSDGIKSYTEMQILTQIVFEEFIAALFVIFLNMCCFTYNPNFDPSWFLFICNMIMRESMEHYFDKPLDLLRMFTLGILYNPNFLILNVFLHIIYDFTILKNKTCARIMTMINLKTELVKISMLEALTPSAILRLDPYFKDLMPSEATKDRFVKSTCTALKVGMGLSFCYMIKKFLIDDDYEDTNLGEIPTESEKEINNTIDDMIQGTPESSLNGLSKNNAWKQMNRHVHRPVASSIPKTSISNVLKMHIIVGDTKENFRGVWSNGAIYTVFHPFKNLKNVVLNFSFINEEKYHTYSLDLSQVIKFDDIITFPWSPNYPRNSLSVIADFVPKLGDEVKVGNLLFCKKCRLTEGKCGCKVEFTNASFVGNFVDKKDQVNDGSRMVFDGLIEKGHSGLPVYLIKRNGKDVERQIIGLVVSRIVDKHQVIVQIFNPNSTNSQHLTDLQLLLSSESEKTSVRTFLQYTLTGDEVRERLYKYYGVTISDAMAPKSTMRHLQYDEAGCVINNIGEFVGHIMKPPPATETKFYKTEFFDKAQKYGADKYVIPDMTTSVKNGVYRNPLLACLRQMNSIGDIKDEAPFWSASIKLYDYLRNKLDLSSWDTYDISDCILGDPWTTAMNRKASKGFPYSGNKDEWITGSFDKAYFKEPFAKILKQTIEDMDKGILPLNISVASLKDEIISKKKDDEGKVRVFFAGNFSYLVLCRIYLGKFLNIFTQQRMNLFPKIGLNALGSEFHEMVETMFRNLYDTDKNFKEFVNKKVWIDGDFSAYDKLLLVLKYAIHVVWWLACEAPFFVKFRHHLLRLKLILTSMMEYVVIIGEDIFIMRNRIPSGLWGTALINCLCECIIEILQFFFLIHLYHSVGLPKQINFVAFYKDDFFKSVSLSNYGDDNLKCILEAYVKIYNHDNIMKFANWIRIPITPARKHEEKVEPKSILDCLFLKRVFVWNDHLDRLVGRLEMDSIGKMLAFSDTTEIVLWRWAVLTTAERELALWGPEYLSKFQEEFGLSETSYEEILDKINGEESMIPTMNSIMPVIEASCEETSLSESLFTRTNIKCAFGLIFSHAIALKYEYVTHYIRSFGIVAREKGETLPDHQQLALMLWDNGSAVSIVTRVLATAGFVVRTFFSTYIPYIAEELEPSNVSETYGFQAHYDYSVIAAPIVEEIVKHLHPYIGYAFALGELYWKLQNMEFSVMMLLCVAMHIVTTHMTYDEAVIAHMIYNAILWNGSFR